MLQIIGAETFGPQELNQKRTDQNNMVWLSSDLFGNGLHYYSPSPQLNCTAHSAGWCRKRALVLKTRCIQSECIVIGEMTLQIKQRCSSTSTQWTALAFRYHDETTALCKQESMFGQQILYDPHGGQRSETGFILHWCKKPRYASKEHLGRVLVCGETAHTCKGCLMMKQKDDEERCWWCSQITGATNIWCCKFCVQKHMSSFS